MLVVAGCGSAATKQDVIARADAICASTLHDVRAVAPPAVVGASHAAMAAFASYLDRVLAIVETEAAQLRKLPRPQPDRGLLERYVESVARLAGDYRALAAAARAADAGGVANAEAALRASDAPALAAAYGLRTCASSGTTAVAR